MKVEGLSGAAAGAWERRREGVVVLRGGIVAVVVVGYVRFVYRISLEFRMSSQTAVAVVVALNDLSGAGSRCCFVDVVAKNGWWGMQVKRRG